MGALNYLKKLLTRSLMAGAVLVFMKKRVSLAFLTLAVVTSSQPTIPR